MLMQSDKAWGYGVKVASSITENISKIFRYIYQFSQKPALFFLAPHSQLIYLQAETTVIIYIDR